MGRKITGLNPDCTLEKDPVQTHCGVSGVMWRVSHRCPELGPAPDTVSWRQLALVWNGCGLEALGCVWSHSASEEMQWMLPDEISLGVCGLAGLIARSREFARL